MQGKKTIKEKWRTRRRDWSTVPTSHDEREKNVQ